MPPSTSTQARNPVPTFASLGVRPLINARGTYTILSGSRILPQVAEAMVEASNHYVHMDELQEAVGRRLAELTGAEWGYIASGCAAILAQVAAACIVGADPQRMARLPEVSGLPHEIIMQRAHRNAYDWSLRLPGGTLVEVNDERELLAAFTDQVVLVAINADADASPIPIARQIALARDHGVPTLVDAAAQRPNVPDRYLAMGADVVAYSGGKCLRGPQSTGYALGRKDLLWAAYLNAAPHHALCRPMKSGKEEIMGLLAAIEAWLLGRDHDAEWRRWEGDLERIRQAVCHLPSVQTRIQQPGLPNNAPLLHITWDAQALGLTPKTAHDRLWCGEPRGEPRIALHQLADGLAINPYMLEQGDAERIAERLPSVLQTAEPSPIAQPAVQPADVAGDWLVQVRFVAGSAQYHLSLTQVGEALQGSCRSRWETSDVTGSVAGEQIRWVTQWEYQASRTTYTFSGTLAAGDPAAGILRGQVDLQEYGHAQWQARRTQQEQEE
jgi:L-seryl-tRNA(Ser) seleniumtransferase